MLQIPLWNSVFFAQTIKSRVQENQLRTFYCPRLACKGFNGVEDYITDANQLNTSLIQQIPKSYRALYVSKLILHIDAAPGREVVPRWPQVPRG